MLGHLYLEQGSYDEAATWFDVAAQHKKAGFVAGEALEGLALSYEAKGQVEKAVEYLEKALEKKSLAYRYPELRWKLALLNRRLGRYEQTRSYCKAIVNDTLATKMKQKAQNLLVEIKLM
jgi:tetratricopeptide (TPR) repeat protein